MYTVLHAFDEESSAKLCELGQSSGSCEICSIEDGPTAGLCAGIKGMIIDSIVGLPLVSITELEATDGTTDYCADDTLPEETEMETEYTSNGGGYGSGSFSVRAGATLFISAFWVVLTLCSVRLVPVD